MRLAPGVAYDPVRGSIGGDSPACYLHVMIYLIELVGHRVGVDAVVGSGYSRVVEDEASVGRNGASDRPARADLLQPCGRDAARSRAAAGYSTTGDVRLLHHYRYCAQSRERQGNAIGTSRQSRCYLPYKSILIILSHYSPSATFPRVGTPPFHSPQPSSALFWLPNGYIGHTSRACIIAISPVTLPNSAMV